MLGRLTPHKYTLYLNIFVKRFKQTGCQSDEYVRKFILKNTEIVGQHNSLTPEVKLRLLTPNCRFWRDRPELWPFHDPYWAIYWPGGQALSRYRFKSIVNRQVYFYSVSVLSVSSLQVSVGQPWTVSGEIGPGSGQRLRSLRHRRKTVWRLSCSC